MMLRTSTKFLFLTLVCLSPVVSLGATFSVDFDRGTLGTQPGFAATTSLGTNDNSVFSATNIFPNAFGTGQNLQVDFSGSRRKNRGTLSGSFAFQSALLGDWWGTTNNDQFEIDLIMPSGSYNFTSFHHDELGGASGNLTITDASGVRGPLAVVQTFGDAPLVIGQFSTVLRSNGLDPVTLVVFSNSQMGINGFTLEQIPEPSTIEIWISAAIVLAFVARTQLRRA